MSTAPAPRLVQPDPPHPGTGPGAARKVGHVDERLRTLALPAAAAAVALAILAPVLADGFVLTYDMVFAAHPPLLPETLGMGSALPRAVPADAVVAALSLVVPGAVLQKTVLIGAVFAAALGAGRLVPSASVGARLVAATAYGWNAYVAERLFIGHWGLLVAYAALPWVASAALAARGGARHGGARHGWARLALACAPAVLTPTGGLLAAGVAMVVAGPRRLAVSGLVVVTLNAPWWVPALLQPGRSMADPAGAEAFRVRSEGLGGPVVSVLGLGGIWNADTVPDSRAGVVVPVLTVVLTVAGLAGLRLLARHWGRPVVVALGVLTAAGLAVALVGVVPAAAGPLRWATTHVPGFGLLRDGQKWTAWWALLLAPCLALVAQRLAERVTRRAGSRRAGAAVLGAAALLPVILLPDLAAAGGRLRPVRYPADFAAVSAVLADPARPGDVLVLPFSTYRRFAWNGDRTVVDPASRALPRRTVSDDDLPVGSSTGSAATVVRGEDERVDRVRRVLATPAQPTSGALGDLGIGWVLVEHGTPGPALPAGLTAGLTPAYDGPALTLYRLPGPVTAPRGGPARAPILLADAAALLLLGAALLVNTRTPLSTALRRAPAHLTRHPTDRTAPGTPRADHITQEDT